MTKQNIITQEGYDKLVAQREFLVTVRRKEVAEKLKEARSFGDLSENAEYDEAKNEQGILEAQIAALEIQIQNSVIVADDEISTHEVGIGTKVKLKNLEADIIEEFAIVGSNESDPENGKISDESPIGRSCLKKKVGDKVEVTTPDGSIRNFEVLEISKA